MTAKYRFLIFLVLSLLSAVIFFREAIAQVFSVVIHREGSSHGVFVPFLALYFLYLKSNILNQIELKTDPAALP